MKTRSTALGGLVALVLVLASLVFAAPASAATLTEITNFGTNPTNLRMHLYVPNNAQQQAPILVAVHYCTGTGPGFYSGTEFASLADRYGFIVIYPSATRSGQCFDVYTQGALTHNGNSDPVGIVSMVRYVQSHYSTDTNRVFVTGASSGAMMTNVLLGDYPDVFKAGSAFMGVPFGCFATTGGSTWNSDCANGTIIKTAQAWGDLARGAYPGYSGARPRMQVWHGTDDTTLRYPNFGEEIKQWTNVLGVSQTPVLTDSPQGGWTRTRYGNNTTQAPVEAISVQGVGHSLPTSGMAARAISFFGLDQSGPTTPPTTPPVTTPPTTPPVTTPPTTTPPTNPPTGGPGGCRVAYDINAWNTGLTASITITNTGGSTVNGWRLAFTLPSGQTITSGWNATYSPTSGAVTATDVSYNGTIPPNGSTNIGFQANHTGNTGRPASFTLNGAACTVS
ncbi:extracellular catalytic domain type 1 short-chain-length polyhydroxyalkanoate depolymerase [Rhizomonospora bruguierae]|uniref:extracellular catalytic domain type 1 short-chain-length polyhydroxyalkanoate depolymerase n=1 Tax=Rhizomonospora bruguierae TaxID=1581705 RepID=UPI001BCD15E3|nr:PHB depolymerase family esterase [Micromonospora sp. NBRC 107566]